MHSHPLSTVAPALPSRTRGFALLITITLVAFLVLILVSIASLTRVETTVATNSQQLSMARQNALAALNVALGELQKYAGPDQRATARADIETATPATGTAHWTGVWGNAANPQSDAAADMASDPVRLQWLVSGNEKTDFNPATHLSTAAASFGQITTAPSAWDYTPGSATNNVTTTATVHTAITVGGDDAVLLVGPATAGTDTGAENNYVVAPLVDIKVAPSDVPGAGSTGGDVLVGKYAWWVGDEGVKARINLVDPYVTPAPAMTAGADPASPFRLMAPQRLAVERVPGFESFPVNDQIARKILNVEQSGLAHGSITSDVRQSRFHDLTTTSSGVLADQRRGGLKRDLTFAFAQSLADYRAALDLPDPAANPLIPTTIMPANEHGPTWEQLHSFANLDGSAAIAPQPQTATQHGIYPVLTQARFAIGATTVPGTADHQQIILHIYPTFILANPHNAPIETSIYHVRMDILSGSYLSAYIGRENTPFWRRTLVEIFEGQVFEIDCPRLEAGEARIFTLNSSPVDETWAPVKTYAFTNDWDVGAAKIVIDTGTEIPNNVLYASGSGEGNGLGLHIIFGDKTTAAPSPSWGGNGGTYTPYAINNTQSGNGAGGTWSFSLTDTTGNIYQRVENVGFAGWGVSQYGIRGTGNSPGNFNPPGPDNRQGVVLFRLADSGNFRASGTTNDTPITVFPYYAQMNWRAPLVSRPERYRASVNSTVAFTQDFKVSGASFSRWIRPSSTHPLTHVEWNGAVGQTKTIPQGRLEWIPFNIPKPATGFVSIGQLQSFNGGGHVDGLVFPAPASPLASGSRPLANAKWRPRYVAHPQPIGNSRAHPNVDRDLVTRTNSTEPYYDQSYLLNRQLFDEFFFSTYPQSGTVNLATDRLPNPRLQPFRDSIAKDDTNAFRGGALFDADNSRLAARNLMLSGAFNVNSTSVDAWRSLLFAFQGTLLNGETGLTGVFPRSVHQSAGSINATDGISEDAWNGFRNLSPMQVDGLATQIVAQIKQRGISVALADFINRKLVSHTAANANTGLAGTLQAAIDDANLNDAFPSALQNYSDSTVLALPTASSAYNFPDHRAKHGLEGIAGWLSQADLVQALAPALIARSDTFRIRTYGETRNPATGDVNGRAWCEAIVQRLPDYVSDAEDAITPATSLTSTDNQRFGRRFVVVDFRWLSPEDI